MAETAHRSDAPTRSFYRYLPDLDVHVLDCGGRVDLETGLQRLRQLERALRARPPKDGVAKLFIDFRETVWADESVHRELSRRTRTDFGLRPDNTALRAAIVSTQWAGQHADNERWFTSHEQAMGWLCG